MLETTMVSSRLGVGSAFGLRPFCHDKMEKARQLAITYFIGY